jgi:hypothetical protein
MYKHFHLKVGIIRLDLKKHQTQLYAIYKKTTLYIKIQVNGKIYTRKN